MPVADESPCALRIGKRIQRDAVQMAMMNKDMYNRVVEKLRPVPRQHWDAARWRRALLWGILQDIHRLTRPDMQNMSKFGLEHQVIGDRSPE